MSDNGLELLKGATVLLFGLVICLWLVCWRLADDNRWLTKVARENYAAMMAAQIAYDICSQTE